ncbi:MAG: hypothetical protein IIC02_02850 [Planctomycetes bacterium]|nr:hypothetical protein [Planctomycetota bacterium]
MAAKRKTWMQRVLPAVAALPIMQVGGCFTDDDIRAIVGDLVVVTLDATGVAINNLLDQNL